MEANTPGLSLSCPMITEVSFEKIPALREI